METLKMPRQIDSRDLGLQVLVNCESPDVDIVAVHRLGATPSTTWTKAVRQQERVELKNINWYSSLTMLLPTTGTKAPVQEEKRINWLSDPTMLPALVTNARIMAFNYDSNWYGDNAIKLRLDHVANDLSRELERQRRALIKTQMSEILKATIGVILLGTPHNGTDKITSGELLTRIIKAGAAGEATSLTALKVDNEMVLDTVKDFSVATRKNGIAVYCYFEQKSSKVSKMFGDDYKDFIVDEDSANLDGCESYGEPLDYYELNKFSDPKDGNWRKLSWVIADLCVSASQGTKEREDSRNNLKSGVTSGATRSQNLTPPDRGVVFSGSNNSDQENLLSRLPIASNAAFNSYSHQHEPICLADTRFVTSIAVQLANSVPALHQHICDAITERSDVASQSLRDQWHHLVLRPLLKLDEQSSYVLVVDALDECDDDKNIRIIVQLLAEARSLETARLRVLLTSRPEVPIRHGFVQMADTVHQDFVLHRISPSIIDHDITLFLEYNLRQISEEDCLDANWPGQAVVGTLVQSASGLFIWAATACRFIRNGLFVEERLRTLVEGGGSNSSADPEEHLNGIYLTVLQTSIRPDRCRDPNFCVDENKAHWALAERSIQLMSTSLKKDICGFDAPGVLVADVESARVEQCLPPEVRYACLYWIEHLRKSCTKLCDNDRTHQFLKTHLLHWLEALSWMGRVSEGIYAIDSLEAIALTSDCRDFHAFIQDMKQFALYGRPAIEQAPLQVYCSALVFAPASSIVRKQFKDQIPGWMLRLPKIGKSWNALPHTLEGHSPGSGIMLQTFEVYSDWVKTVVFSLDGKILVLASTDSTIKLWDAKSGALLRILEGRLGNARAVAFSPDSRMLATASEQGIISLWNIQSEAVLQTLDNDLNQISTLVFSPNGKIMVSGSRDGIIKLWDIRLGSVLQKPEAHSDWVFTTIFSSDSNMLASASNDGIVKLWNIQLEVMIQIWKGYSIHIDILVFSPDSKNLASVPDDNTVKLWNARLGVVLTLKGHSGIVTTVVFSPDSKILATGSEDNTIKLWNTQSEAVLQTFRGHSDYIRDILSYGISSQEQYSRHLRVKLWDVRSGAVLQTLNGGTTIETLSISDDGTSLQTDIGSLPIQLFLSGHGADSPPRAPSFIFVEGPWVYCYPDRILWLPPEHRPELVAVQGSTVSFGYPSGRVAIMEFASQGFPKLSSTFSPPTPTNL
ncbi:hypothetical protein CJF32_00006175 [Rutstroemia sp. NJR-2017a WRK4]|nr:hypothetical protein CJF32_00006175 [Rutstroemia sp. NJR-2017a WRK4]